MRSRYSRSPKNPAHQLFQKSSKSASTTPHPPDRWYLGVGNRIAELDQSSSTSMNRWLVFIRFRSVCPRGHATAQGGLVGVRHTSHWHFELRANVRVCRAPTLARRIHPPLAPNTRPPAGQRRQRKLAGLDSCPARGWCGGNGTCRRRGDSEDTEAAADVDERARGMVVSTRAKDVSGAVSMACGARAVGSS